MKNTDPKTNADLIPTTPDKSPSSEFASHPSASLQSVIKHNEDLMARLSVNLRRVGHLEKIIEDLNLRFKVEKSNSDSLRDELLIYTEKNRLSESQLQKTMGDLSRSVKKNEQINLELQSVKSDLNTAKTKYEFKLSQLELELSELVKIKEDTDTNLKPRMAHVQDQNKKLQLSLEEVQAKNEELKEKLLHLSHQAQSEALRFQNLSKDLQSKIKEKDLIISQFETLDEKVKTISKEKALLENKNIDLEHELKKNISTRNAEAEKLHEDLSTQKNEIQKLKVENYELKKSWADAHAKTKDTEAKAKALEEQSQSLQHMWQEKNRKHSELESQLTILETMRHELSLKVRTHETEIKSKNQKISDLLALVETMRSKGQHEKEAILETAIRGMKNLYFEEDEKPSTDVIKNISF